jgi:hypothetical protein
MLQWDFNFNSVVNVNQDGITSQELKIQDLESSCNSFGNAFLLNGCQKQNISELAPHEQRERMAHI